MKGDYNIKSYKICVTIEVLIFQTSALKKKIQDTRVGQMMEKDKRILEELRSLHCNPHPYFSIFPSESDFSKWHQMFSLLF